MEYSNDLQDVYKNIEDYYPNKKMKVLIVFDNMIADMIAVQQTEDEATFLTLLYCFYPLETL